MAKSYVYEMYGRQQLCQIVMCTVKILNKCIRKIINVGAKKLCATNEVLCQVLPKNDSFCKIYNGIYNSGLTLCYDASN